MSDISVQALRRIVRDAVNAIEHTGPSGIGPHIERVRAALAARGLRAGCHEGSPLAQTPSGTVEWYAGQLLSISDRKAWYAMNSFVNLLDKFCPASGDGE